MTNNCDNALNYAHTHSDSFLNDLKAFVRIPSISTNPASKNDMVHTAEWLTKQLKRIGLENVTIFQTTGHPVVFAERLSAGKARPTILIYGHYDVQPPEPIELWNTPPFEPTQQGENLFGRGASDMKGQVVASLKAIESIIKTGDLPINLKFLIEGEEEIGSPSLGPFITNHKELLACDYAINPDTGMLHPDIPTITYGLRGLAYFEIQISGPDHDLHSGIYGGAIHNPAQVLCELVAGMHDKQGRITLPGFYDQIRPITAEERLELKRLPIEEDYYLRQSGAPAAYGENGYSEIEQIGARPTLEVNGILSGFTGEGSKTVIPARAMAKISMRLVPDQDPAEVHKQLLEYIIKNAPETVTWQVKQMAGGPAVITNRNHPAVQALSQAMEATWGKKPVFKREGGSVPVVVQMQSILGIESILTGFGLPDDRAHSPNEKLHIPTFFRGIDTLIRFFSNLGEV